MRLFIMSNKKGIYLLSIIIFKVNDKEEKKKRERELYFCDNISLFFRVLSRRTDIVLSS